MSSDIRGCLRVLRAGPGATVQDGGRFGFLRYGVTPAGPMDWTAFRTANFALGNDDRAAAIEVSTGGLEVVCEGAPLWVAFAGGAFVWRRSGMVLPKAARICLEPGETLMARAGEIGRFHLSRGRRRLRHAGRDGQPVNPLAFGDGWHRGTDAESGRCFAHYDSGGGAKR